MITVRNLLLIAAVITYFGFCCVSKPAEPITDAFPIGSERSYALANEVTINHKKGGKSIGYRVNGILKVGAIWGTDEQKLLKFHLISPKLQTRTKDSDNYEDQKSPLDTVSDLEFYATWELGKITKSFFSKKEDASVLNLKKALISLFQYQLMDGRYEEEDVGGSCDVVYRTKSPNHYEKIKTNCRNDDLGFHSRDPAVGVSALSWRMSEFVVTQDGTLDKVESREYHEIAVNAFKSAGGGLESFITLKFDGSISNIPTIKEATIGAAIKSIKGVKFQPLQSNVDSKSGQSKTPNLKTLVKSFKDDLTDENVGKFRSASAIATMVPAARTTSKDELLQILKSHTMKDCKGQLLDLMAATQTKASHEAVKTIVEFTSAEHQLDAERYLQSLAIGTRPQATVIKELLQLTEKKFSEPKMKDTLIQTIASMGYHYARLANQNYDSEIVKAIEAYLLKSLKTCKEPLSKIKYIRALQNLQSPNVNSILWQSVYDSEKLVSVSAMKALRSYPNRFWSDDDKKEFLKVFYQQTRKFDSSARTLALDVILELQPSVGEIKELLHFLRSNDKAFEVKQYLLQNLVMKGDQCAEFKLKFTEALSNEPLLNNYHIIGQKGMSTALSRTFSKPPSFNGTLLSIQEVHRGVLKRGIVDMTVDTSNDNHFSLFTLELYSSGLTSFMGGSSDDDDSDANESTTAGMEIKVQGAYFRPLEFFNGQGDLMGHVWSGTASEPTPAYTATTVLHDHEEILRLQNGAALRVNVLGAMSIDLNGQVQLSLWNKNAHCQVDKNMGIALTGSIKLETSFISLDMGFTITEEPNLQLLSDSDFASDVQLCMQLTQPEVVMSHDITKVQQIPGYTLRRKMSFVHRLPGYTHFLNQKNNEMCSTILS